MMSDLEIIESVSQKTNYVPFAQKGTASKIKKGVPQS